MKLNRTGSNWDRLERNKINENWDIIEGSYNSLEGEFDNVVGTITDEVVGHLIDSAKLIWKEPVDNVGDLPTNAEVGETRMVREADPDGISYVYRYDGENWEKIQAIDVTLVNEVDRRLTRQLAETILDIEQRGINVERFGAVGDFDEKTETGTDNLEAFKDASEFAKENNVPIYVPTGNFMINGFIEIYDSLIGEGTLFFPNENPDAKIKISSKHTPVELDVNNLSGLLGGSSRISGINDYSNHTLIIESDEILINRYNPPSNTPYTKNEVAIITNSNGDIVPALDFDYDKTKIKSIKVVPPEKRITIDVDVRGFGETNKLSYLFLCERSNVVFSRFSSYPISGTIQTHVSINNCALIEFYRASISNARVSGYGYGISIGNSAFTSLTDCHINDCRHSLSGRHGKAVVVSGGSYSDDIDTHWGSNYVISGAKITGRILYAGKDLLVDNNEIETSSHVVVVRQDTPEFYGSVYIINNKIKGAVTTNPYLSIFSLPLTTYSEEDFFNRTIKTPSILVVDANTVDCDIDKEVRLANISAMSGVPFEPIDNIIISENHMFNNNVVKINLPFNDFVSKYNKKCKLTIEKQEMNGWKYQDRNITIVDQTTTSSHFLYDINVINCNDVALAADETTFDKISIARSKANYLARVGNLTAPLKSGIRVDGCVLEDCTIGFRHQPYHLINTEMRGEMTFATTSNLKSSIGTYALPGTGGLPGGINFFNYLSDDYQ